MGIASVGCSDVKPDVPIQDQLEEARMWNMVCVVDEKGRLCEMICKDIYAELVANSQIVGKSIQ